MRVLFISSNNFPKDWSVCLNGTRKRQQLLWEAIKEIAHLDLLYYVPPDIEISPEFLTQQECLLRQHLNTDLDLFLCAQQTYLKSLKKWQKHAYGIFDFFSQYLYKGMSGLIQIQAFELCLERKPDVIFVQRLTSMPPVMLTHKSLPPIIFDLDDIEHVRFLRQLKQSHNLEQFLYALQLPVRLWGELKAIKLAKKTFVCSELDRRYLNNSLRLQGIETIPNAVVIPEQKPLTIEPILLSLGSYCSGANVEAANFLIEQVLPKVQREIPEAKLIIAGEAPENIRSYGKNLTGVEFTGFVNDLDDLYRRSRIVCNAIFAGAGTRVKMVEAAAYAKPIVSTCIGAEGLEMTDGRDFLLRNNPNEFAQACILLLKDITLCTQLGSKAYEVAVRYYDRTSVTKLIQQNILKSTNKN